jgi:hypothetical protein
MKKHSTFTDSVRAWRRQDLNSAVRPKGEPTSSPRCDEDLTFDRLTGVMVFFASIRIGNAFLRAVMVRG